MVEQKLFGKSKETNCDIMFLARLGNTIRLMGFKSNPWLQFSEYVNTADKDVYKHSIFIFSGSLILDPAFFSHEHKLQERHHDTGNFSRRFNRDKI